LGVKLQVKVTETVTCVAFAEIEVDPEKVDPEHAAQSLTFAAALSRSEFDWSQTGLPEYTAEIVEGSND